MFVSFQFPFFNRQLVLSLHIKPQTYDHIYTINDYDHTAVAFALFRYFQLFHSTTKRFSLLVYLILYKVEQCIGFQFRFSNIWFVVCVLPLFIVELVIDSYCLCASSLVYGPYQNQISRQMRLKVVCTAANSIFILVNLHVLRQIFSKCFSAYFLFLLSHFAVCDLVIWFPETK